MAPGLQEVLSWSMWIQCKHLHMLPVKCQTCSGDRLCEMSWVDKRWQHNAPVHVLKYNRGSTSRSTFFKSILEMLPLTLTWPLTWTRLSWPLSHLSLPPHFQHGEEVTRQARKGLRNFSAWTNATSRKSKGRPGSKKRLTFRKFQFQTTGTKPRLVIPTNVPQVTIRFN